MSLRIVVVSSEAVPFAKTGGLADVAGALPAALAARGHRVHLILPCYRMADPGTLGVERTDIRFRIPAGDRSVRVALRRSGRLPGVQTHLVEVPEFFDRPYLYGGPEGDYPDNGERFGVFARAAVEVARRLEGPVDILHANDWQTGLIPIFLRTRYAADPALRDARVVFTIHNLAYQGNVLPAIVDWLHLPSEVYRTEGGIEFYGAASFLKAGLLFSDALTTVSPRYSEEIQTPEFGSGFDGILRARRAVLRGILNGIDYGEWDPAHDAYLPRPYSLQDLAGKRAATEGLCRARGFSPDSALPIVGMVTRLADQKGLDLIEKAAPELMALPCRWVILGTGDRRYHELLQTLADRYPDRLSLALEFNNSLAHLIYGGSDLFLMPSRYEPCGLGQMISLRYGTVPVVRLTGGLADTIVDAAGGNGTGFGFEEYSAAAMVSALRRALAARADSRAWEAIVRAGMGKDYSWGASARAYEELYESLRPPRC